MRRSDAPASLTGKVLESGFKLILQQGGHNEKHLKSLTNDMVPITSEEREVRIEKARRLMSEDERWMPE